MTAGRNFFALGVLTLIFIVQPPLHAQNAAVLPDPYDPDEFPLWARDLRRAEVIAFGALPFTVFFASLAMDSVRYASNDWDRRYAPWPLKPAGAIGMDESERIAVFSAGVVSALAVSLADQIITRIKRNRAHEADEARRKGQFRIERESQP